MINDNKMMLIVHDNADCDGDNNDLNVERDCVIIMVLARTFHLGAHYICVHLLFDSGLFE